MNASLMNTEAKEISVTNLAPILLFVYKRLDHTIASIEALKTNIESESSDLIIYSDGPKFEQDNIEVKNVRDYIDNISGFKSIKVHKRPRNLGLSQSIIDGVTRVLNDYPNVIVLEDDIIVSRYFLSYMNSALEAYKFNQDVVSIHSYVYPVDGELPETFFLPGADCWGWATWKHGWDTFECNGMYLLNELIRRKLTKQFDFNGTFPFTKMLRDQIAQKNDSWAIRWYASAFLMGKFTLYPGRSLVKNIGNDNSGTHSGVTNDFDVELSNTPIDLNIIPVKTSVIAKLKFQQYFKKIRKGLLKRVIMKFVNFLSATA